ncbi:MAG: hydrazine synthase alpha subunit [Candidatus Scalindua rubra]|uniref:Hydrazine synthase alpha subunit n=1 Tax=Candidatus Scalindua rubra TaxID=1872076 RepID=A0A1E3XE43_9BACT|nr:MAG: hydrazine synthase alpha subunit [Candidatus Scalindua rubra]
MKKGFIKSMALVGVVAIWGLFGSNCQAQVMTGGHKPGKAIWGDYWGMAIEAQGNVESVVFTQSKPTLAGDPYHQYPNYVSNDSRIVSYNTKTRSLKVLTKDFQSAYDPCLYWDCTKIAFAGVHKNGGGSQLWEMNIDGSNLRQLTDAPGTFRSPLYYAAGAIEKGKGRVISRDRYFEGDWRVRGEVEKMGFLMCIYSPEGSIDEFGRPFAFDVYRLDPQGGKSMDRIAGHVLVGIDMPNVNTVIDQITYNVSSNFDPALTRDGNILYSSTQANGTHNNSKGSICLLVNNWTGAYPRHIYGNETSEQPDTPKIQAKESSDGYIYYIEALDRNSGIGNLARVSWTTPHSKTQSRLTNDGRLYRSPHPVPDGRLMVSSAERRDFGIYWFDKANGTVGNLVYDDPEWNDHQPEPVYSRYKPRWINAFTAGNDFGVTTVTYQPFDQVKVEGYPHSWSTTICFDTTLTNLPIGPYPHQRAKVMEHGDIKAIRVLNAIETKEPDSSRYLQGAGSHLLGGAKSSSNSGTSFSQRRMFGYQYVEDDGSVVSSHPGDEPYCTQILDDRGMAVQTQLAWAYVRPYGGRICTGCHWGSYDKKGYLNLHTKALYNWWYSDLSHYDSPFMHEHIKLDKKGKYAGVKHGDSVMVPSDVYYGGPSGTTSATVEGLYMDKLRTVDFRRDIQPIIDEKCASCHGATQAPNLSGSTKLVSVKGVAAFSKAYNSLLAPQRGRDTNIGGRYVNPSAAINSLLIWRLYEEELSQFAPRANPIPLEGRVMHNKFLTNQERFLFVEWVDLGAQWDNIQGPDPYPGYRR